MCGMCGAEGPVAAPVSRWDLGWGVSGPTVSCMFPFPPTLGAQNIRNLGRQGPPPYSAPHQCVWPGLRHTECPARGPWFRVKEPAGSPQPTSSSSGRGQGLNTADLLPGLRQGPGSPLPCRGWGWGVGSLELQLAWSAEWPKGDFSLDICTVGRAPGL